MKCLLLSLGLALVCGLQAATLPPTMEDLDIRQVWACGVGAGGPTEGRKA